MTEFDNVNLNFPCFEWILYIKIESSSNNEIDKIRILGLKLS